ncbi:hypothetical protein KAZ01_03070, partial [Candidatus Gracilibacteria bacterium]|nr:hypothetical protein [Candidatus Gracilibacteria bacterium]
MENIKKIMLYSAMITVSIAIVSSTYADDTTSSGSMTNSGSIVNSTTSTGVIDTTTSTGTTTTTNTGTTVDGATTTTSTGVIVGGDKDNHGCIGSAGYTWCGSKNKCIRSWEEKCEVTKEVQENWVEFHENYGFLKDYFKKDLNIDQKKAVLKLMQDHMKAVKNLLKSAKDLVKNNNFDKIAFDESVKTMISKHIEEILPYIDSTKVDKFKLFMEERQKTVIENIKVKNEMKKPS